MESYELDGLRDAILQALHRMPRGMSVTMLQHIIKAMTFDVPEKGSDSLLAQLFYLEGKGLIKKADKQHTPSNVIWQLTAEGDDHLRTPRV